MRHVIETWRTTTMSDGKTFAPSTEFAQQAIAKPELYTQAKSDRLAFWAEQARALDWAKPFTEVLDWSHAPVARWFDEAN